MTARKEAAVRTRSIPLVAVLGVLALVLAATPAAAVQVTDPDDVAGKLDLKTLVVRKADASAPLIAKITTYENWAATLLKDSGHNRICVLFDVDADGAAEYVGKISSSGGDLHMDITGQGSAFEPLPVKHPDGHTIKTVVPGGSPPNPDGTVQIAAKSVFHDTGTCSTACKDRAPNTGWLAVP
jgi:hypothetical protein